MKDRQFAHDDVAVVLHRQAQALDDALHPGQGAFGAGLHDRPEAQEVVCACTLVMTSTRSPGRDRPADAEAGHAVQLGDPVDHDDPCSRSISCGELVGGEASLPSKTSLW